MSHAARVWTLVVALAITHFLLRVGLGFGTGAPDLLTISLLIAARETRMGWASSLGLSFGLLEDALSVLAFGANTVAMTLLGIVGAFTRDLFVGDSRRFFVAYLFGGKWLRDFMHWIMVGEQVRQPFIEQVVIQGAIGAFYAAAVGVALLAMARLAGER